MLSGITIFDDNIDYGHIVEGERELTKSHLACQANQSARVSGIGFKTKRTDVLRSILDLREHGWNFGHVESFRVEHCVIGAVVHGVEDDLEIDNLVRRRQLSLYD